MQKLRLEFENKSDLAKLQEEFTERESEMKLKANCKDSEIISLKDKLRKCNIQLDNSVSSSVDLFNGATI